MRRVLLIAIMLVSPLALRAQNTLVSGTISDSSSQAWKNGTYSFTFNPSPSNPFGPYFLNGAPFNISTTVSGSLDNTGALTSVPVPSNALISPAGSTYKVQVCPAAGVLANGCFVTTLTISGASQTITSSVVPPPLFVSLPTGSSAYSDSEILGAKQGSFYVNLTDGGLHYCSTVPPCVWVVLASSGSILGTNNTWTGNNQWQALSTFNAAAVFNSSATFNSGLSSTTGSFSGVITSTLTTGTSPFSVASSTVVPSLNVSFLLGNTWAVPPAIGITTPNTGLFTNLTAQNQIIINGGTALTTTNQTGTGNLVLATSPTITTPTLTNPVLNGSVSGTGVQGTETKVASAGALSTTAGIIVCTTSLGGVTTTSCPVPYTNGGKNTSVCSTGAGAGSSCTTSVTLARTEADTNYFVGVTCIGPSNFPLGVWVATGGKGTTAVNVELMNGSAGQAQISSCAELDVTITR